MAEILQEAPIASALNKARNSVIAAVERLSDDDTRKLRRYAAVKALQMSGAVFHSGADDLLHDAIERTLDGRRKWDEQNVEFTLHLIGCMRSIVSEFRQEAQRLFQYRQSEGIKPSTSRLYVALRKIGADAQSTLTLERIRADLSGYCVPSTVFDRLCEGYTRAEIVNLLGIDQGVYEAARKKIYRCIKALL